MKPTSWALALLVCAVACASPATKTSDTPIAGEEPRPSFAPGGPDAEEFGASMGYARPGGNVTGSAVIAPELVGKCLELLKQAVPGASHVAVLWHPGGHGERLSSTRGCSVCPWSMR